MTCAAGEDELVAALRSGAPFDAQGTVRMIETHGARVFLTPDRAYKVKRPVRFAYFDFSTLEKRKAALERELELNRRTAPDLYLRVAPLVRSGDGALRLDGAGDALEWVLVMRRFPDGALLSEQLEAGRLGRTGIEALAEAVAAFHARAEIRKDAGGAGAMRAVVEGNIAELEGFAGNTLEGETISRFAAFARGALADASPRLDERRAQGFIRHCHGDLHLGNVFLDGGRPVLFDCIEFDNRLAVIDVYYDLAFLLMDLVHRGRRDLANAMLNGWFIRQPPEEWPLTARGLSLLPLFVSQRAAIRAKVAAQGGRGGEARTYLDTALALAEPAAPRLVAVGGLSGSGKTVLARALAPLLAPQAGALHLRSDEIRKRLAGAGMTERLSPDSYTREASLRVYGALYAVAATAVAAGHPVVADAVFAAPEERLMLERIAAGMGIPFTGIWLDADPKVLMSRVSSRKGDASDASAEVVAQQLRYRTGNIGWHRLDASRPAGDVAASARVLLQLPSAGG